MVANFFLGQPLYKDNFLVHNETIDFISNNKDVLYCVREVAEAYDQLKVYLQKREILCQYVTPTELAEYYLGVARVYFELSTPF